MIFRPRAALWVAALCGVAAVLVVWRPWAGEAAAVRGRLDALAAEVNATPSEGLEMVAHLATLGSYFTPDVTVDLGRGSALIQGREMLVGMASRLQRRTSDFELVFDDMVVQMRPDGMADVRLTASFRPRAADEDPLDAREFEVLMTKQEGRWRIARLTAVETLK